jgi:hypothetical protein
LNGAREIAIGGHTTQRQSTQVQSNPTLRNQFWFASDFSGIDDIIPNPTGPKPTKASDVTWAEGFIASWLNDVTFVPPPIASNSPRSVVVVIRHVTPVAEVGMKGLPSRWIEEPLMTIDVK